MKVTLMEYTKDAVEKLIFAKRTRLNMSPDSYKEVLELTEEEKALELYYVMTTIGSGLEFVDYTFLIEGVSRAFTHQLVRHRVGVSFAQQAQRAVDLSAGFDYISTGECEGNLIYDAAMGDIKDAYNDLITCGIPIQDARGLLPTNISTNIMMKINLRSFLSMAEHRLCYRAQGEFQSVMRAMAKEVVAVHPWLKYKVQPCCIQHQYCPFPRFLECPMKEKYSWLKGKGPDEIAAMADFYEALGSIDFQPANAANNKR